MSNPASAILGEVSELTQDTVSFNATHTVSGASGAGHFDLITSAGLSQYLSHFADVELLTDSLTVSIRGPVTATIATTLDVCVIPAGHTAQPALLAGLRYIQGSFAKARIAGAACVVRGRLPPAGGRQSSGAGRLPYGYARAVNGRDGGQASFVTTCLPVDPPSSLRSAADRIGNGLALGPLVDRKVRLGSVPERSGV
jgi:hypothetical protein